jgi:enoyl-CoA hydratase/carnithine racemase
MNDTATLTPQADKMLSRKEGHVGYVIFNNPERHNAVSLDMWEKAVGILDDFRNDKDISVVVVTGAGGKAFVSGADISRFEKERSDEAAVARYGAAVDKSYAAFHEFPKPTIAMIRGYCIGGGMGLATCCDLRIATEGSKFAVPAAKLGLGYGYTGLKRLVDIVGPSFAMEIFYTARQFTAAEAVAMGLVNRVVADGELESFVKNYAETMAGNAPLTIKAVKVVVSEMMKEETKRDLKKAQAAVDACFRSKDYEEGRKAFMEKRKPVFTGN